MDGIVRVAAPFWQSAYLLLDGVIMVALICLAGSRLSIKHPGWGRAARTKAIIGLLRVLFLHQDSREGIDRCLKIDA